jgi:hypothetical protein
VWHVLNNFVNYFSSMEITTPDWAVSGERRNQGSIPSRSIDSFSLDRLCGRPSTKIMVGSFPGVKVAGVRSSLLTYIQNCN